MRKRLLAFASVCLLCAGLVMGCSKKEAPQPASTEATEIATEATEVTTEAAEMDTEEFVEGTTEEGYSGWDLVN